MKVDDDYCVFDLETSIKNTGEFAVGKMKAAPFCKDNQIVMLGMKRGRDSKVTVANYPDLSRKPKQVSSLYVGQNIKFDLLYMLRDSPHWHDVLGQVSIWDTMIVEYLLSGQKDQFMSLDKLATKYGGTLKDDRIKDFWNEGINTEDIPEDMLEEYLIDDVLNTEIVYLAQKKEAERLDMMPLIESQMDAVLMTTIMEFNGMKFDAALARERAIELRERFDVEKAEMDEQLATLLKGKKDVNCLSNQQLSVYLFGGTYKYVDDVTVTDEDGEPVRYKGGNRAGQIKTRKETIEKEVNGLDLKPKPAKMKTGYYQVDDKTLSKYDNPVCQKMVGIREMSKSLGTYYEGYLDLLWPDGCIHGSLQHCSTNTGRLSSNSPNLQNISAKGSD